MVRFFVFSVLACLAGTAVASAFPEQEVILDTPARTMDSWSYTDCGLPSDAILIESITLNPDPPQPGHDLTIIASGTATEVIEDGAYAEVVVKLGLIKLLTKKFDVCEEARAANASIQCPVEKGDYTVQQTVSLPREIPRAKFSVHVEGYTASEDPMLCLDLKVDFMKAW